MGGEQSYSTGRGLGGGGCSAFNTLTGERHGCPAACPTGVDLLESANANLQACSVSEDLTNPPLEEKGPLAAWLEEELVATFSLSAHSNGSLIAPSY